MSIRQRLEDDLKNAMKQGDRRRVSCIRMLRSGLLEREVALRAEHGTSYRIADDEALAVISAYAKQRRDSIESYRRGGREDLASGEQAELDIVVDYLPRQLSEDELRTIVGEAITEAGAQSVRDLGAVMKLVASRTKGRADGKAVNRLVREMLSTGSA